MAQPSGNCEKSQSLGFYATSGILNAGMAFSSLLPLVWIGGARADLSSFPDEVKDAIGYALYVAQLGAKHAAAKPLQGFGGAGVLEIVEDHSSGTYRAVYVARFAGRIYVLHAFQKKSRSGIKTPKSEMNLVRARLKLAAEIHAEWLKQQRGGKGSDQGNSD